MFASPESVRTHHHNKIKQSQQKFYCSTQSAIVINDDLFDELAIKWRLRSDASFFAHHAVLHHLSHSHVFRCRCSSTTQRARRAHMAMNTRCGAQPAPFFVLYLHVVRIRVKIFLYYNTIYHQIIVT